MRSFEAIIPIILAAGNSTRMGHPKALLPFGNRTFLTHILEVLKGAGLPKPVIVLGNAASEIRPVIGGYDAGTLINHHPEQGQLSSIRIALSSLPSTCEACMLWPVDQPAVSETLVLELARLFVASNKLIALPVHGRRRGHPAIFHRDLFPEFMDAPLTKGPKAILVRHKNAVAELPADEPGCVNDVDTPAEYRKLTGESPGDALEKAASRSSSDEDRSANRGVKKGS